MGSDRRREREKADQEENDTYKEKKKKEEEEVCPGLQIDVCAFYLTSAFLTKGNNQCSARSMFVLTMSSSLSFVQIVDTTQ